MPNTLKVLTSLLAAAFLAGGALAAAPTPAQRPPPPPAQGQRAPQAAQVTYYRGDPLAGGQRLTTSALTPQPGGRLFQDAPRGATFAVVSTPSGRRVVNLQEAGSQPPGPPPMPGEAGGPPEPRDGALAGEQPGAPLGERGAPGGPRGGGPQDTRRDLGGLGGALRGASRVTFYGGDPLRGGRVLQTVTLAQTPGSPDAALTRAARQARFAVVERPGERWIVDLTAAPGQPAPQAPQR